VAAGRDEKHTTPAGDKLSRAATAGLGCCLSVALARSAGNEDLEAAPGVFRAEARCLDPEYRPETVTTDGWAATQANWRALFPRVVLILRFLHAFLKVPDRAKPLGATFETLRTQVSGAYQAGDARSSSRHCVGPAIGWIACRAGSTTTS